jgi:hypothetical protein
VNITITDVVAPKVTQAFLHYGASRKISLSALGRSVLSWSGINKVSVVFSEDVQVGGLGTALSMTGLSGSLSPTFAGYNAATRTATWTFAPIGIDRVTLQLSAAGVIDIAGNSMAADYTASFGVLPGDVDGNGIVDSVDVGKAKKTTSGIFADINGDGKINTADSTFVSGQVGNYIKP